MTNQTPPEGTPTSPWVVSSVLFGPATPFVSVPLLAEAAAGRFDRDQDFRREYLARRPERHDHVLVMEADHEVRIRNTGGPIASIEADTWARALSRVGEELAVASLGGAGLTATLDTDQHPNARLRTSSDPLDDELAAALARALAEDLRSVASDGSLCGGYVHVDGVAEPYETIVSGFSQLEQWTADARVAGYYWTVLLNDHHVEVLGGRERVLTEAPVWRAEPIEGRILCTLTEDPLALDEDVVRTWRDFLRPVLVPGFPGPIEQPPARSTWIYEGPLVARGAAMALSWGAPGPRAPSSSAAKGGRSLRIDLPDGDAAVRGAVEAVISAWLVMGRQGIDAASPVGFEVDAGASDLMMGRAGTIRIVDDAALGSAVDRLAAGIGATAQLIDAAGSGPYGAIVVERAAER